jgi:hypothetical protein
MSMTKSKYGNVLVCMSTKAEASFQKIFAQVSSDTWESKSFI